MNKDMDIKFTESESITIQTISLEYLKSISKYETEHGKIDKTTKIVRGSLQSVIKKLEASKINAGLSVV